MTLREHFSALAMQGAIANGLIAARLEEAAKRNSAFNVWQAYAEDAVNHADALIAELAKEKAE